MAGTWNAEDDEILVCRQVRRETADVKSFILGARRPARFDYRPGQFLTFEVEVDGQVLNRCYTISSSPTRPDLLSITVKRVPGGPVSNWLHDHLVPGMEIKATGPMGEFCHVLHPAPKYLFLSAGSGVTPLMSMARQIHDLAEATDVVFLHAARTPADIVFREEQALIARNLPQFRVAAICEGDAPDERWAGIRGRITAEALAALVPDFGTREIFTCGPAPFMAAVRAILGAAGFDMAHYHEESFDFGVQAEPAAEQPAAGQVYRVEFTKSRRAIDCPAGMNVLEAARRAGMRLPSSCTKGLCGTCKSRIVSGKVDMTHAGGIRQREIDQGLALICCSKPLTDLVIER
ncbi:2Fe-2S iron-sulfur cluster-binding protein [Zavarzinia sp.]|uniref:2Fe-2S iron-sulfur cluster-binding protein n=1 Tax=Zavarzinia sp. TaxID=2027920 RepID=UPI0035647C1F